MLSLVRLAGVVLATSMLAAGQDAEVVADTGETALAAARQAKQAAYELDAGNGRGAALLEAAKLYTALARREAAAAVVRSEAAFRAGEILRAHGSPELAAERFELATGLGQASEVEAARTFGARAALERAHIDRRDKQVEAALARYAEVGKRFPKQAESVARARGWAVRLLIDEEQLVDARVVVDQMFADIELEPLECLRAVDRLALAHSEAGEQAVASSLVALLRQNLEPMFTREPADARADKLRLALEGLRVTVRLAES